MIKSLSPYYITTPFVSPLTSLTCTSYTLYIYVWSGLQSEVPVTETYKITKDNPTNSTDSDEVNIARLINDFIDFKPIGSNITELLDGSNQRWVKTEVTYKTTDPIDETTKQLEVTDLMVLGYGYGIEGANTSTPTNKILLSGDEFKVSRNGYFSLPIYTDGNNDIVTAISYPSNEINFSASKPITTDSNDIVRNLFINVSEAITDSYIELVYNGVVTTLLIEDECRYTPLYIFFQNKEGQQQCLTFFKSKKETMSIESEVFESDRGQPINWVHQYVNFNVQAKSKFSVNSGFVSEDNNESFKQLLLSERIWLYKDSNFIPLNINTKSIEYKTRQKDRLINYEIGFDYAYNEINNI